MVYTLPAIIALIFILAIIFIQQFNKIRRHRNQIENAKSSLDALFIKRNELIPNLITILEQHIQYESKLLKQITELRQSIAKGKESYESEGKTDKLMKQFMLQLENYPELKASRQYLEVHFSINECEEQIAAGRRYLSSSITYYNNSVTTFPGNFIGGIAGMRAHEWEHATEEQRKKIVAKEMFIHKE